MGLILGLEMSLGGGHDNSLQYYCLENPMDRGSWWATVHRVAKSQTRLKQLSMHTCIFDFLSDKRIKKATLVLDFIPSCVSGAPGILLDCVDFDS